MTSPISAANAYASLARITGGGQGGLVSNLAGANAAGGNFSAMVERALASVVEKGKDADLLVVAGDPASDVANLRKVRYVVRRGVVRSIEELSAAASAGRPAGRPECCCA